MTPFLYFTIVALAVPFVGLLIGIEWLRRERSKLLRKLKLNELPAGWLKMGRDLPYGAKISWKEKTGNGCLRCQEGGIWQHTRRKVILRKNEAALKKLSSFHRCDNCSYWGIRLKD